MNIIENAKHLMVGTGAQWVLWLLIALSVVSVAIILERAYVFWSRSDDVEALRDNFAKALRDGGFGEARNVLRKSRHPAAMVCLRGMRREENETSPEEAEEAMAAETIVQRAQLESRLSYLATLGANAPFIGLFGTVVGVLASFDALGKSSTAAANAAAAASAAAPQAVMSSLAEALVATATGIIVAIPAVFAFNIFQRLVKGKLSGADLLSHELLAFLHSDKVPAAAPRSARGEA